MLFRSVKGLVENGGFPGFLLPALVFAIAAFLSFAMGTAWGTFGILIPDVYKRQAYSIPPATAPRAQCLCRRAPGTVPEVPIWEARPLLFRSHLPQGGGKLRGFAAHTRRARERPERALFSAVWFWRAIRLHLLGASAT